MRDEINRINNERTVFNARYQDEGADTRYEYLEGLADQYGVALDAVLVMADLLGPNEDFDGLVSMVEDMSLMGDLS